MLALTGSKGLTLQFSSQKYLIYLYEVDQWIFYLLADTSNIRMFVLDEADEMLSRGFKDQIYDVFKTLKDDIQVSFTLQNDLNYWVSSTSMFLPKVHNEHGGLGMVPKIE